MKKELANALDDQNETMFVVDGTLITLEVHNPASVNEEFDNLAQKIEAYPELKESLERFIENPDMEHFTAKELNEFREH